MKDFKNINIQDVNDNDNTDFYTNFKERLADTEQFPTLYTFKFIVPASEKNKKDIEGFFEHPSTKINIKDSKTGKYNSLTVETFVNSPDDVVEYYKKVSAIEKVIML
ncbi:DUF493 domain-containing protein [Sphingobacterium rhinopitheci]|uniref:DUF493 domain-containing protein n=1 Tax=Sphingobacterium rhinopitheci TaxID=2781960 RepID=UPI001F529995|nr:DUF493 domain-containing protein [Sphingobacterium rhinopitheci]MCI0920882.1 DUF493 domain-containing protein [Sphingobacterium rhinopitheci]